MMLKLQFSSIPNRFRIYDGKWVLWVGLLVGAISLLKYWSRKRVRRVSSVPVVAVPPGTKLQDARKRFYSDAQSMLLEGYKKYKESPFYVPTPLGERLMIPPKYVEELKNAPMEDVDFVGTFFEMFEGRYTTMGSRSTLHPRVTRLQLNQHLDAVIEPIRDEIITAFNDEVPVEDDWVEVDLADRLLWIVARASSRMFGGKPLARDTMWLLATLNFAMDGFVGAQKIKQYPKIFRPVVAPFIKELRRIPKHYEIVRSSVKKILNARGYAPGKPASKGVDQLNDFLQWMIDDAKGEEQGPDFLADILLKISFAALHTSAATPTQLVYDLCERPEYIAPLRAEVEEVLKEHPTLDKRAFRKMRKLDSFMKESLRFNPLLLVTFQRILARDYVFTDGFRVPAGTFVGSPSQAITMDPELYPNPEVFDGYRHEKMEQAVAADPAAAGRTKWASANLENMAFGYGRHACPGRFFADYEIKLIMAHLLMTYDFEYAEGQKGRPANLNAEIQMIPSHSAKIRMRRRRAA